MMHCSKENTFVNRHLYQANYVAECTGLFFTLGLYAYHS